MTATSTSNRTIEQIISGMATQDGAGVKLTRTIGSAQLSMLDPFLMLDCFESDQADDYIKGFPPHPHRGFETVTYMLDGKMRHQDNKGNEGVIASGGIQWMSAGRGIIHSEMPEQQDGLLKGFQLWVNLPAEAKMGEPNYQEHANDQIPVEQLENGGQVKVIAGKTNNGTQGPINNSYTQPSYFDVELTANRLFEQRLPEDHNAFIYVIEGQVKIAEQKIEQKMLGVLSKGELISIETSNSAAKFLLIAGKPLNEPVARSGPFVMNNQQELVQAFNDYKSGNFTA